MKGDLDTHHFSLLVGGVDINSNGSMTPHLFHLNPSGFPTIGVEEIDIPVKREWDVAAIGKYAKQVTTFLKTKYENFSSSEFNDSDQWDGIMKHALQALGENSGFQVEAKNFDVLEVRILGNGKASFETLEESQIQSYLNYIEDEG